jgi:hypothetical protein
MTTENLKFKIQLYAQYWDKPPIAEIIIGDQSKFKQEITGTEQNPNVIEIYHELEEGQEYKFVIHRTNKDDSQTIVDNNQIIKDQLLFIKSIEIDEIDLGGLVYEGVYYPQYSEPWASEQKQAGKELPVSFKNVTSMGHNGRWELGFTSPFYMWLLENLY